MRRLVILLVRRVAYWTENACANATQLDDSQNRVAMTANPLSPHRHRRIYSNWLLIKLSTFFNQNRILIHQFFKYFFIGAPAAMVDLSVFTLLVRWLTLNYLMAVFFSFTAGTLSNFFLCDKFIFKREELNKIVAAVRHYLSSLGGLIINTLIMIFIVEIFSATHLVIGKCIANLCAAIINFLLIRFFAFNSEIKLINRVWRKEK